MPADFTRLLSYKNTDLTFNTRLFQGSSFKQDICELI